MSFFADGCLLRVFIDETNKKDGIPLYSWLVRRAKEIGVAGATVTRSLEGYGGHHRIHTAKILELSMDLPVVIEFIDTQEKIEMFIPVLDDALRDGGLATLENVKMQVYTSKTG